MKRGRRWMNETHTQALSQGKSGVMNMETNTCYTIRHQKKKKKHLTGVSHLSQASLSSLRSNRLVSANQRRGQSNWTHWADIRKYTERNQILLSLMVDPGGWGLVTAFFLIFICDITTLQKSCQLPWHIINLKPQLNLNQSRITLWTPQ